MEYYRRINRIKIIEGNKKSASKSRGEWEREKKITLTDKEEGKKKTYRRKRNIGGQI